MEIPRASNLSKIFAFWIYKPIRYYVKSFPSLENMLKAPNQDQITSQLEKITQSWADQCKTATPSFLKVMLKVFFKPYLKSVSLICTSQTLTILQSLLIDSMVQYLHEKDSSIFKASFLVISFLISSFLIISLRGYSSYSSLLLAGQIKAALSLKLSEKVLKLKNSTLSQQDFTAKIFNTLSTDFESFELIHFTLYVWSVPFVVPVAVGIIYLYFDVVGIVGIGVIVLHLPLIALISKFYEKFKAKAEEFSDKRVKMIEKLINGIKFMKFYVWEKKFYEKICEERENEVKNRRKAANLTAIILVLSDSGIILTLFVTLLVYVKTGGSFSPNQYTFLTVILFNTHSNLVVLCNYGISTLLSIFRLFSRVGEILSTEEFHESQALTNNLLSKSYSLKVKNLQVPRPSSKKPEELNSNQPKVIPLETSPSIFEETPKLISDISFKLLKNELILLTGRVGSGKSVLLQSILQEFKSFSSKLNIQGKISYLPSNPWIIAGTIKDNILMGRDFDAGLYEKVVESCGLEADLKGFELNDLHKVGDQGCNLSGGQKARICLARVVYSQADIYLLDDPLSAVDNSVARHIFRTCFRGLLKRKSIIIATHQTQFIKYSDKVMRLNQGRLEYFGTVQNFLPENFETAEKGKDFHYFTAKTEIFTKQSEEQLKISLFKITWKFLLLSFKRLWKFLIFLLIFIIAQGVYQACYYYQTLWSSSNSQDSDYFFEICGILTLFCFITFSIRIYQLINSLLTSSLRLHNKALKGLTNTSISLFNDHPVGVILNRFTKDVGVVDGPLQVNFYEMVSYGMFMIEIIIISAITLYFSVLIIPLWVFGILIILKKILPVVVGVKNVEISAKGLVLSSFSSVLNGITTIRNLKLEEKFTSDLRKLVFQHHNAYFTLQSIQRFSQFYIDIISFIVASFTVILILSLKSTIPESLSSYCLISCFSSLGMSFYFTKSALELSSCLPSVERLLQYANLPKESNYSAKNQRFSSGSISFVNVYMKYHPGLPFSLKGFNLSIISGQKVGIVGRTGAGKSSILQILFRLVNPDSGTVYIDGVDYKSIDLHCLRSQISIIPQTSTLFAVSLRENIDPFNLYSDEQIWKVLKQVGLNDVVSASRMKLEAVVGTDDFGLSDGQAQLLCIARILLKENFIVVMDEATANLDHQTDQFIQKIIKERFKFRTFLVIAHRIRTIVDSDLICVMSDGKCVEYGTHCELLGKSESVYRQFVEDSHYE